MTGKKISGGKEYMIERAHKAFSLRISGMSCRKIAAELGVSHQTIMNDIAAILEIVHKETFKDAKDHIALELSRLDAVCKAMSERMSEGDPSAASVFLKACESRRKLLGLDAAIKTELTGANGGPVQVESKTIDDLRQLPADELQRLYHEAVRSPNE